MESVFNFVICYHNENEVVEYAKKLRKQSYYENIVLCIVNNSYSQESNQYLNKMLNEVDLTTVIINNKINNGYLNGLIKGYKDLKTKIKSRWVIFSNTDILFDDNCFIENFLKSERYNDTNTWIIGPVIYAPLREQYSNPYMLRRPSKIRYYITNIIMTFPNIFHRLHKLKQMLIKPNSNRDAISKNIYAVHGSFMFLDTRIIELIAARKSWEILYNEEAYLAEIARKYHKRVYYDSTLVVNHLEGQTTSKVKIAKRYEMMKKSNNRILQEFYTNK